MNRKILAAAAATFAAMTVCAGTASACISCEYTPEVVTQGAGSTAARSHAHVNPGLQAQQRAAQMRLAQARAAHARMAQKRMAQAQMEKARVAAQRQQAARQVALAKEAQQDRARPQPVITGSIAKPAAETKAATETQATVTADADTTTTTVSPASTSTALLRQAARQADVKTAEAVKPKPVGCKKFLPAVGVTVDCK